MVQFAGWDMPLVYEGSDKGRVAGGAGELATTFCESYCPADNGLEPRPEGAPSPPVRADKVLDRLIATMHPRWMQQEADSGGRIPLQLRNTIKCETLRDCLTFRTWSSRREFIPRRPRLGHSRNLTFGPLSLSFEGPGALKFLEYLLPASLSTLPIPPVSVDANTSLRSTLSVLLNEEGGILDDCMITRWGQDA